MVNCIGKIRVICKEGFMLFPTSSQIFLNVSKCSKHLATQIWMLVFWKKFIFVKVIKDFFCIRVVLHLLHYGLRAIALVFQRKLVRHPNPRSEAFKKR